MKNTLKIYISIFIVFFFMNINSVLASDTTAVKKDAESASEKITAEMALSYKISNGVKSIKAILTAEVDDETAPLVNTVVNLYLTEVKDYDQVTNEGLVATQKTNYKGEAIFTFTPEFYKLNAGKHEFNFIASATNNPRFEDMEESITMSEIFINLTFSNEDSIVTAMAKLTKFIDGAEVPVPETEMKLLIKRTFSLLTFSEDGLATDENGEVAGEVPSDIPGNKNKTITIVARYDDEDNNGVIEYTKTIPWSVIPVEITSSERTFWGARSKAPIPLIAASLAIIIGIWGVLFYLVIVLFKIRKIGHKQPTS